MVIVINILYLPVAAPQTFNGFVMGKKKKNSEVKYRDK